MVVLHAFAALVAGFATSALVVAMVTVFLKKLAPAWAEGGGSATMGYTVANLGSSFLAAAAGGYVTAWAAQSNPLIHVLALAITALLLAALSALQQRGQQPIWFILMLVALTPIGVLAGGLLCLRVMGIL